MVQRDFVCCEEKVLWNCCTIVISVHTSTTMSNFHSTETNKFIRNELENCCSIIVYFEFFFKLKNNRSLNFVLEFIYALSGGGIEVLKLLRRLRFGFLIFWMTSIFKLDNEICWWRTYLISLWCRMFTTLEKIFLKIP